MALEHQGNEEQLPHISYTTFRRICANVFSYPHMWRPLFVFL
jgi:hypothetical protein